MATSTIMTDNFYQQNYDYTKKQGVDGAKPRTYEGTIVLAAGITQKNGNTFPLVHAKDIQLGQVSAERLTDRLNLYDSILRAIYGELPSTLANLKDGRTQQALNDLAADNGVVGATGVAGIESLAKVANILDNRTETIDNRLKDLRAFDTFAIGASQNNENDLTADVQNTIKADNNADSITVSTENKWIILKGNATNDSFTIGHYKKDFNSTTAVKDLNTNSENTIVLQVLGYDKAGHITSEQNTTYTLPQNFKTISVVNTGINNNTNDITTDNNSITANNSFAEAQFIAGNKWIRFATNNTNRTITFAHALSDLAAGSHGDEENQTPNFATTFTIPEFSTDAAGHVTAYTNHNISMPALTLTAGETNANVVTGISMADNAANNGKVITETRAYIGSLALNGYVVGNNSSVVAATDTLNAAIAKLQNQITNEVTASTGARDVAITTAINALRGQQTASNDLTLTAISNRVSTIEDWKINGNAITSTTKLNGSNLTVSESDNTTINEAIQTASMAHSSAGYLTAHQSIEDIITAIDELDETVPEQLALLNTLKTKLGIS